MRLRTLVNGEVRQDASCSQMITGVPELIAYISNGVTLEPGDIIATGTPSGVALGMKPPKWLQPGGQGQHRDHRDRRTGQQGRRDHVTQPAGLLRMAGHITAA